MGINAPKKYHKSGSYDSLDKKPYDEEWTTDNIIDLLMRVH